MNALRKADPARLLIVFISLILVTAVAVGAGYATRGRQGSTISQRGPQPASDVVRGVVQAVTADSITVQTDAGPVTLKITPLTGREAIQKTTLSSIQPGDWVNAGGVHHDQTIYALTDVVVIPASDLEPGR